MNSTLPIPIGFIKILLTTVEIVGLKAESAVRRRFYPAIGKRILVFLGSLLSILIICAFI